AERLRQFLHRSRSVFRSVEVEAAELATDAGLLDLPGGVERPLLLAMPGDPEVEAEPGQGDSGRAPDAAVSSGDDRDCHRPAAPPGSGPSNDSQAAACEVRLTLDRRYDSLRGPRTPRQPAPVPQATPR